MQTRHGRLPRIGNSFRGPITELRQHIRVTTTGRLSIPERIREVLKDPDWWLREVFTALLVGVLVAAPTSKTPCSSEPI
jgi:hypothetical protein